MVSRKRSEEVGNLPVIPEEEGGEEQQHRKRHFAGANRRISTESSKQAQTLLQELAEIKVPEKLPEPFD